MDAKPFTVQYILKDKLMPTDAERIAKLEDDVSTWQAAVVDFNNRIPLIEADVAAIKADDAKLHGILDTATDFLKRWPWATTLLPALLTLGGTWFAAKQGVIGETQPAPPAPLAQVEKIDYEKVNDGLWQRHLKSLEAKKVEGGK